MWVVDLLALILGAVRETAPLPFLLTMLSLHTAFACDTEVTLSLLLPLDAAADQRFEGRRRRFLHGRYINRTQGKKPTGHKGKNTIPQLRMALTDVLAATRSATAVA